MLVMNELDRYHLTIAVIERVPGLGAAAAPVKQRFRDALVAHAFYIRELGEDMPSILNCAGRATPRRERSMMSG